MSWIKCILVLFVLTLLSSCTANLGFMTATYSTQPGNLPPDVKTIVINNFNDFSGSGPPELSIVFTEKVKEYYQNNTRLLLENLEGDLKLEGEITRYDLTPIAPTGDEVAAQMRLTITVNVVYTNNYDDTQSFQKPFSFYSDFDQSLSITDVQDELIDEITDQIILDIFTATLSAW